MKLDCVLIDVKPIIPTEVPRALATPPGSSVCWRGAMEGCARERGNREENRA